VNTNLFSLIKHYSKFGLLGSPTHSKLCFFSSFSLCGKWSQFSLFFCYVWYALCIVMHFVTNVICIIIMLWHKICVVNRMVFLLILAVILNKHKFNSKFKMPEVQILFSTHSRCLYIISNTTLYSNSNLCAFIEQIMGLDIDLMINVDVKVMYWFFIHLMWPIWTAQSAS